MRLLVALALLQGGNPYLALGRSIPKADWERVVAEIENPPAEATPLAVRRAATERWAGILEGLRKASDTPVPAKVVGEDAEAIRRLASLAVCAAYVRFSEGERTAGTTLLLDGFRMARRLSDPESETMLFVAFADHLNDLPLAQCERVRKEVETELAGPTLVSPRERTDLCLLRLHLRIEAYRWRYFKLPTKLSEAASAAEIADPVSRKPFRYDPGPTGYRLWSESLGSLGKPPANPSGASFLRS